MSLNLCAVQLCAELPYIDHPLNLCRRHALAVSLNVTDRLHANALSALSTSGLGIEEASAASPDVWTQGSHPPVVYFLVNGDRVKIGTSTNVVARVSALSLRRSNAALLLQGGNDLERALHDHFESDRIGKTEWFVFSSRIKDYIARRKASDAALRQPELVEPSHRVPAARLAQRDVAHVVIRSPKPIADDIILETLRRSTDPSILESAYMDRPTLLAVTGLRDGTFANALGRLETAGKIHRVSKGKSVRVGLGPAPDPGE